MRDLNQLNRWRRRDAHAVAFLGTIGHSWCGVFMLPDPLPRSTLDVASPPREAWKYLCIATTDGGWDHVSISLQDRCPTWDEMDAIKRLFFKPDETAMQLHVPPAQHINCHPFCLHLWRPQASPIPLPPLEMVGPAAMAGRG